MRHSFTKLIFTGLVSICFLLVSFQPAISEECTTGKTLILYYSLTENTRAGCDALQRKLDATIVEINDLRKRSGKWGFFKTAIASLFGRHTKIEPEKIDIRSYPFLVTKTNNCIAYGSISGFHAQNLFHKAVKQ